MAGNSNSGRKPKQEEHRKALGKYFKSAVAVVAELLIKSHTPDHVRLDAAKLIIEQQIGKPKQRQELSGELLVTLKDLVQKAKT